MLYQLSYARMPHRIPTFASPPPIRPSQAGEGT
jgi:hypothetical protein